MEQAIHLKETVEKLDLALARLQEIQSTLQGHGIAESLPNIPHHRKAGPQIPKLIRFHELSEAPVDQSADWRRWSTPTPLMHDALSDAVAASKFAKKTVDMVKVQKKQASNSTNTSQAKQTLLLHPSNRVNLPQSVMAGMPNDARGGGKAENSQPLISSKENRRTHHQSKLDLKDVARLQKKGGSIHVEKQKSEKTGHEEASSSLHTDKFNKHMSCTKVSPDEDVIPNIIQLRRLMHVEDASTSDHHGFPNIIQLKSLMHVEKASISDHHSHGGDQYSAFDHTSQNHGHVPSSPVKRSSLSMRTLMQMEDAEKMVSRQAATKNEEDADPFSSTMPPKSFCVQLEEIKSSRRKSWSFSQGKASDNVVVMFPNPTFDETTLSTSTQPDASTSVNTTIKMTSHQEDAASMSKHVAAYPPSHPSSQNKSSIQKREKIVRLSPCSTTSNAQKPKLQSVPTRTSASGGKRASPKKQKWLCTSTHPPSPTVIRRLPEVHEMKDVKQETVPSTTISTQSVSVGRPPKFSIERKGDEEDKFPLANDANDDDKIFMKSSWSFGKPSAIGNAHTSPKERRSSLGAPGGHSFSFLSKHFNAWKLASKQDR